MSEAINEVAAEEEAFTMPTVAHKIVLHFKNLVVGKDDGKIAELKHVASKVDHVKFTAGENESAKGEAQQCIKRDSEEYTLMIPDFGALLKDLLDEVEGLDIKEVTRVQELVAKHVTDYSRSLVDGKVEELEDGSFGTVTGFQQVTNENTSFLLSALESFGRAKSAAAQTVPAAVRDAAVASLRDFLSANGLADKGIQIICAATKSYFSPTTVAQLNSEALAKIQGRIAAWYDSLEADERQAYGLFFNRQNEKINKALNPEELEVDIF